MTTGPLAQRHALYRFYGDTGQLLYVGITNDPGRRLGQHAATKTWWHAVRGVSLDWYSNREDALAAEKRAIAVERPLANVVRPEISPPRWTCGHCDECAEGAPCRELGNALPCPSCGAMNCAFRSGLRQGNRQALQYAVDAIRSATTVSELLGNMKALLGPSVAAHLRDRTEEPR